MSLAPACPVLRLVLVGAGHAHVGVLRDFARRPAPGIAVTLVTRESTTPYSGAIPLLVAGHLSRRESFIDARRLARLAGAAFMLGEAVGLDPVARRLDLADGSVLAFDHLSLDIGSSSALPDGVAGSDILPVKPIGNLPARVDALVGEARARRGRMRVAVVGAGVAGVELIFALRHRLRAEMTRAGNPLDALRFVLAGRSGRIAPTCSPRTRARLARILQEQGIAHVPCFDAVSFDGARLVAADGREIEADATFWASGSAAAPLLKGTGLALDARGFVAVDEALRSRSHPHVWAAGDIAALPDPRPKAGVFAVRQGPVLAENLRRAARGAALETYRPQTRWLSLISTGGRHAIADRGRLSLEGAWAWRWKKRIDSGFVRSFNNLPDPLGRTLEPEEQA